MTWGTGNGGWNDGTRGVYDDWLQVNFAALKAINEIRVYTLQNNWQAGAEPTTTTSATGEGLLDFEVQTWNGSAWVTVPSGNIVGNTKAITVLSFSDITTDRIRVLVHNARNNYSRIVEVEAFTCGG